MTKVLALLGSPRSKGNNYTAIEEALRGASSCGNIEIQSILLNNMSIKACQHCDGCLSTGRCIIRDDMDVLYESILNMDAIVLAAPIYFSGLSAQVKLMIDRCQPFWAAKDMLKKDLFAGKHRTGMLIVTGGQPAYDGQFTGAVNVVKILFRIIGVKSVGNLILPDIDTNSMKNRTSDLEQAFNLGRQLILR